MVILCGQAKAVARYSLTGLNIIIFHDGLLNISYCDYNQKEKLENNYKTSIWKSQHYFFKKRTYTHARTPLFLFLFVRFSLCSPCSFDQIENLKVKMNLHLPSHCSIFIFSKCIFYLVPLVIFSTSNVAKNCSVTHFVCSHEKEKRYDIETLSINGVSDKEHFYRKLMQKKCSKS